MKDLTTGTNDRNSTIGPIEAQPTALGPFEIYECLGRGGMAVVHRAIETREDGTKREVALKRLLPHCSQNVEFVESFLREASLTGVLRHPNVARTLSFGPLGTSHYLSMEYIEGHTILEILRACAQTGAPPISVTLSLLSDLCCGLDYIHNKCHKGRHLGLIHRDISPANLILDTTGVVRIIDFGIAKAAFEKGRTQDGLVKGKLSYMSPEALTPGKILDLRSDLFSVGVVAHELLTVKPLFYEKTPAKTVAHVLHGKIPLPSSLNPRCPGELDAFVEKALARDPSQRYQNAAAMLEDLRALTNVATREAVSSWSEALFVDSDTPSAEAVKTFQNGVSQKETNPGARHKVRRQSTQWPALEGLQANNPFVSVPTPLPNGLSARNPEVHVTFHPKPHVGNAVVPRPSRTALGTIPPAVEETAANAIRPLPYPRKPARMGASFVYIVMGVVIGCAVAAAFL